jgi:hypothetical protein
MRMERGPAYAINTCGRTLFSNILHAWRIINQSVNDQTGELQANGKQEDCRGQNMKQRVQQEVQAAMWRYAGGRRASMNQ